MSAYSDLIFGTPGLLGYWRLGETVGNMLDAKGTNHALVVGNITCGVPGLLLDDSNQAAQNDGTAGPYILIPDNASLNVPSPTASVECWFKPLVIHPTATSYILSRNWDSSFHIRHYKVGDARVEFRMRDSANVSTAVTTGYNGVLLNTVSHLVMTYNNTAAVMQAFVNGVLVGNGSRALNANVAVGGNICLFDRGEVAGNMVNGVIDEFAYYNIALTPQQVADHYKVGTTVMPKQMMLL